MSYSHAPVPSESPLRHPTSATRPLPPAIRCRELRKVYEGGVEAVRGLDLEVHAGECFGLLGPNGAGKTTTIEILEGLLAPTSGQVEVLGEPWGRRDPELRQRIGISLQETRLSEKLTVLETIRLFRSFYRSGLEPEEAMARVSLEPKRDARVGKLSGGQRQRLAVACALVGDPELLFLDEPTSGLDPQSRRQLWSVVRDIQERGRTVLVTTHYMDEAERLCDRVAIVDQGKIIALDSPAGLIGRLGADHVVEIAVARSSVRDAARSPDGSEPTDSRGEGHAASDGDRAEAERIRPCLEALPGVRAARLEGARLLLTLASPHVSIPPILEWLRSERLDCLRFKMRHASLEDVFVSLTGRHLRDGEESDDQV